MGDRFADVWAAAGPYLRARKNDVHVPLSYGYAERLAQAHAEADDEVVLQAILLHDIGWAVVDQEAIYRDGFGPGMYESDVRIAHEKEGARLARGILESLGRPPSVVDHVTAIIDGHDTRRTAFSREDELVRDADRLWRFCVTGVSVACDWFGMTPAQYAEHVEGQLGEFFTASARAVAERELAMTRRALLLDVLAEVPA